MYSHVSLSLSLSLSCNKPASSTKTYVHSVGGRGREERRGDRRGESLEKYQSLKGRVVSRIHSNLPTTYITLFYMGTEGEGVQYNF